jgi:hypothetical protein
MRSFSGHLGSQVSALVDGQLGAAESERAWAHVLVCPDCRRQVERETWVKKQLSAIATTAPEDPPPSLLGSLQHLRAEPFGATGPLGGSGDPDVAGDLAASQRAAQAWAHVDGLERRSRNRRRAGLVLAGAGSVSAAVFGLASVGGAGLGIGTPAPAPTASFAGSGAAPSPSGTPTVAVIAPGVTVHGRLPAPDRDRGRDRGGDPAPGRGHAGPAASGPADESVALLHRR